MPTKEFIDANPSGRQDPDTFYDPAHLSHTRIPEVGEIKPYLKTKPDYFNSWSDVQTHFLGRMLRVSRCFISIRAR